MKMLFSLSVIFLLAGIAEAQNTWYVPDDYPTIQAAVNGSANGDIVIVRPGKYVENVDYLGKAITVKSEMGPGNTIIDGGNSDSVVKFVTGEGNSSVLSGFTLINGSSYDGGGVFCDSAAPVIKGNVIYNNSANYGAGISVLSATEVVVEGNLIRDNYAWLSGAGIHCYDTLYGRVSDNIIWGNTAQSQIGGIECQASTLTLQNNVIAYNDTQLSSGGGIACIFGSHMTVVNNTIYGNTSAYLGGGVSLDWLSSMTLVNSIVWDNNAYEGEELFVTGGSVLDISHCDVQEGMSGAYVDGSSVMNWGASMIDADPLLVIGDGTDFHLTWNSPCREGGDGLAPSLPDEDFEGDPRIASDAPDLGADEAYRHLYYTGAATPGGGIKGKLVGMPGASPVGLFFGSAIQEQPIPTAWGMFRLQAPLLLLLLPPMPSNGVMVLPAVVPLSPAAPYDIPMQAMIGLTPDSLTNLCVLEVR